MNKQQFIEKIKKEFRDKFAIRTFDNATMLDFNDFLQSKLSECWDMAREKGMPKEIPKSVSHIALEESLKLQAHYARLLNDRDGGTRTIFKSVSQWLNRLKETGTFDSLTSKQEEKL